MPWDHTSTAVTSLRRSRSLGFVKAELEWATVGLLLSGRGDLLWAHFINFYVPDNKDDAYVKRAWNRCYEPLLSLIASHENAHLTFNVDGHFLERLQEVGLNEGIEAMRGLVERGQVELTASAYGGPALGPMTQDDIDLAVKQANEVGESVFADAYTPKGFFPPEMSYDHNLGVAATRLGFQWMLLDEISHLGKPGSVLWDRAYKLEIDPKVKLLFRDRSLSQGMAYGSFDVPSQLMQAADQASPARRYVLTGVDADLYGMRRIQPREFLTAMMEEDVWDMLSMSELLMRLEVMDSVTPVPGSWSAWDTFAF